VVGKLGFSHNLLILLISRGDGMIQVQFTDDSRSELRLLVKSPPCDAIPANVDKAPDLLFSALKGQLRELLPALEAPVPDADIVQNKALPSMAAAPAPVPRAMSSVDRLRNPMYNMFGQKPASPAA
jgi:hypothetical protein